MTSILKELWYGNVCPSEGCREVKKETKEQMKLSAEHHDNLYATLNEKQKEILEKFDDCSAELIEINERDLFVYAFRLEAKMMLEVMLLQTEP